MDFYHSHIFDIEVSLRSLICEDKNLSRNAEIEQVNEDSERVVLGRELSWLSRRRQPFRGPFLLEYLHVDGTEVICSNALIDDQDIPHWVG